MRVKVGAETVVKDRLGEEGGGEGEGFVGGWVGGDEGFDGWMDGWADCSRAIGGCHGCNG